MMNVRDKAVKWGQSSFSLKSYCVENAKMSSKGPKNIDKMSFEGRLSICGCYECLQMTSTLELVNLSNPVAMDR